MKCNRFSCFADYVNVLLQLRAIGTYAANGGLSIASRESAWHCASASIHLNHVASSTPHRRGVPQSASTGIWRYRWRRHDLRLVRLKAKQISATNLRSAAYACVALLYVKMARQSSRRDAGDQSGRQPPPEATPLSLTSLIIGESPDNASWPASKRMAHMSFQIVGFA